MNNKFRKLSLLLILILILFMILGCTKDNNLTNNSLTISSKDEAVIQNYLDENIEKPSFGGKVFSAYKILGSEQGKIYVEALMQEYYIKNNKLEEGSGLLAPLVLNIETEPNGIKVVGYNIPRDGTMYAKDYQSMFPKNIRSEHKSFSNQGKGERELKDIAKKRAENWAKQ